MFLDPLSNLQTFFPLFLASALFFIGLTGVLIRKNLLMILMSFEIMLSAVNLNLLAFSRIYAYEEAPVYIFFITCIAAAEAGVGLALAVRVYNKFKTLDVGSLKELKD